jgi:histidyl-tRNA synthetase
MGIKFKVNPNLVRGLDYYTNLVFEFIVDDSTVLAGGRYAKLVSEFGGENYSCIGFGAGLQRLCLLIEKQNTQLVDEDVCDVVIGALTDDAKILSLSLLNDLRKNGVSAVCKFSLDKLVKVFSYAERIKAKNVVIIGAKELENKTVMVKNQTTLEQKEIKIADLIDFIKNK